MCLKSIYQVERPRTQVLSSFANTTSGIICKDVLFSCFHKINLQYCWVIDMLIFDYYCIECLHTKEK